MPGTGVQVSVGSALAVVFTVLVPGVLYYWMISIAAKAERETRTAAGLGPREDEPAAADRAVADATRQWTKAGGGPGVDRVLDVLESGLGRSPLVMAAGLRRIGRLLAGTVRR
eukprot:SAG22_NODE_463_length_10196_cov_4.491928_9_plen_113_part_00